MWSAKSPTWLSDLRTLSVGDAVALVRSTPVDRSSASSAILRGLTSAQLYAVVRSVKVPVVRSVSRGGVRRVRANVTEAAAPAVVLAIHHLTALGSAGREVLGMDIITPPAPNTLPTFIVIASVAVLPEKFVERLLSGATVEAQQLQLSLCVAWCVICEMTWVTDLIGDVLASSPRKTMWARILTSALREKAPSQVFELCRLHGGGRRGCSQRSRDPVC